MQGIRRPLLIITPQAITKQRAVADQPAFSAQKHRMETARVVASLSMKLMSLESKEQRELRINQVA